jgi:hypothetical protein
MVPFAGYELPVLYKGENGGVMKEHLWCRSEGKASLFDVSHMGQVRLDACLSISSPLSHGTRRTFLTLYMFDILSLARIDQMAWKGSRPIFGKDCRG